MKYSQIRKIDPSKDLILPCRKGKLKHLKSYVSIKNLEFEGEFGTYQTLYGDSGNKIYLLGLGEIKHASRIDEAFRKLTHATKSYWKSSVQVQADHLNPDEIKKAVIGIEMARYEIGQFKSEQKKQAEFSVKFYSEEKIKQLLEEGCYTGETINRIKALVDAPSNHKTPEYLGKWASKSASQFNYECKVLKKAELQKQGFEAVLAVGRGSAHPPVVIISTYKGRSDSKIDLGLVGKGITFDTGGLSIKPSQNLHYMKSDMGGASVVLGIVELVARLKLKVNIVGVVASAENAVDSNSYRPGDVIDSYSGKTIEIIDTDAEGRLVMADALSYLNKTYQPDQLIDLATLTGSVVRTLGYSAAGMFTHNHKMANAMTKAGNHVHERVWPLPLFEDFESDLQSDIADLRNFSGKPIAGAINAAKFLEAFTEGHKSWMHLDIAGVSFGDSPYSKMKSATGFGIQLMLHYIQSLK